MSVIKESLENINTFTIKIQKAYAGLKEYHQYAKNKRLFIKETAISDNSSKNIQIYNAIRKRKILLIFSTVFGILLLSLFSFISMVIVPTYNSATEDLENGYYTGAISSFAKIKNYKDSLERLNESNYLYAISLEKNREYDEAVFYFSEASGYKDSNEQIEICYDKKEKGTILKYDSGETIKFGKYEQDNNMENGKETIEWFVLKKENNKALVISKYALDTVKYNKAAEIVAWDNCTLRSWLNEYFYNEAFSKEEKLKIKSTDITVDEKPETVVKDKIFLLSSDELSEYFLSEEDSICIPTEYAKEQHALVSSYPESIGYETCTWWLRTMAYTHIGTCACYVKYDGSIEDVGTLVTDKYTCIRPAMWIEY